MSLVNRVSVFFLVALGVILACYSIVFYLLISQQLHRRFDQQLHAALHQLAAAVEVEIDDVKFEPSDHTIHFGREDGLEDIRWAVFDEAGLVVAQSQNLTSGSAANDRLLNYARQLHQHEEESLDLGDWRVLQQRLAAAQPKPLAERDPLERAALVVTAARSPAELNANLQWLGWLVTVLPLGAWLLAAIAGRWFVSQALRPVRAMADEARRMSVTSLDDKSGKERLPVSATADELAELGRAFNAVLDKLFKALVQQRRFTGDAAHQLRTPLAALRGQIEVARRRSRSAEEHARTLDVLLEQTTELQQTIEGLLFLARADGEATLPQAEPLQLQDWLPEFLQRWRDHARWSDLQFKPSHPAVVYAPPALLQQLLENLVSNALKYSPPGSPVDIELRQADDAVVIAVQDRGPGIADDERQVIFEPFYRSPAARKSGIAGTGLGLAIAARIAIALGGKLSCLGSASSSGANPGSRFVLQLPAHSLGNVKSARNN